MANITLTTPDGGVQHGMQLTFTAPRNSDGVTGILLNNEEYQLVDSNGVALSSVGEVFSQGAMVSVIIDAVNKKATLLNPGSNGYTKTLGHPSDTADKSGLTVWSRVKSVENAADDIVDGTTTVGESTHAKYSDYPVVTNANEIRFKRPDSWTAVKPLVLGYAWSDDNRENLPNEYHFYKGPNELADVLARNFLGTATKAVSDSAGNNIVDTYYKKSDSVAKAVGDKYGNDIAETYLKKVEGVAKADTIKDKDGNYSSLQTALLNMIYPVGSIYMSMNDVSPQNFLGGTWVRFAEGCVAIGAGTGTDSNSLERTFRVGETNQGEYSHTLAVREIPSHNHTITMTRQEVFKHIGSAGGGEDWIVSASNDGLDCGKNLVSATIGFTGASGAHNNMPPYIVCYMWKRTA